MSNHAAPASLVARAVRFLPVLVLGLGTVAIFVFRPDKYLSPEIILQKQAELTAYAMQHPLASAALFVLCYAGCVALSVPGAALMTVLGGYVFGVWAGACLAVLAAAAGAVLVFLAARTSFGHVLRARAGPMLERFRQGFDADAASYLLSLRLAPLFPFWLVNLAPAFLDVKLWTFAWTTLVGIIPGTLVFALAGASLDMAAQDQHRLHEACIASGAAACQMHFSLASLITRQTMLALVGLALLPLLSVLVKKALMRKKRGQT